MAPIAAPMFMCTCVYIQILENNTKCHMAATLGADDPEHWRIELLNQRYFVRLCPSAPCFLGLLKDLPKAGCLFVKRKDVSSDKGIQIGSHRKPKSIEFPLRSCHRDDATRIEFLLEVGIPRCKLGIGTFLPLLFPTRHSIHPVFRNGIGKMFLDVNDCNTLGIFTPGSSSNTLIQCRRR